MLLNSIKILCYSYYKSIQLEIKTPNVLQNNKFLIKYRMNIEQMKTIELECIQIQMHLAFSGEYAIKLYFFEICI